MQYPKNKPFLVGISGRSGAGKTFVIQQLKKLLLPINTTLVSQDDYYLPITQQQKDKNGIENFDLPTAINHQQLLTDIALLLSNQVVEKQSYTFNNAATPSHLILLLPNPIILLEGLFIYSYPEIAKHIQYKLFIDCSADICLARRLQRDSSERGYNPEQIQYQWHEHVEPAYQHFLLPHLKTADAIITNEQHIVGLEEIATSLKEKATRG